MTFIVEPTVGSRIGSIIVAGNTFTVSQEFNACDTVRYKTPPIVSTLTGARTDLGLTMLVVEDFNNDGVSDLVQSTSQPEPGVVISLSRPEGGYNASTMIYTGAARRIRAGDLNDDGKNDLILVTSEISARMILLYGDGAGGFSAPVNLPTGPNPLVTAIADFNGDNIPDLAVVTGPLTPPPFPPVPPVTNNVAIHLGDGAGGFLAPKHNSIPASIGSFPTQIEAGDFNGDGKKDLAVNGFFGLVAILTGDGGGNFTASGSGGGGGSPRGVMALGDFNGDGKTDIAISRNGVISFLISTAAGTLQPGQALISPSFGSGIVVADFNGDGRSDIAAPGGVGALVMYATGGGAFTEPISYLTGGVSTDLFLGDFNRDGRDDLFAPIQGLSTSSAPPPDLVILLANGQGEFEAPCSSRFATTISGERELSALPR